MNFINKLKAFFRKEKPKEQKLQNQSKRKQLKEGLVRYFNRRKGYGFISSKETQKDVFVHLSDTKDRVRKGDRVLFEIIQTPKGLKAKNVELKTA